MSDAQVIESPADAPVQTPVATKPVVNQVDVAAPASVTGRQEIWKNAGASRHFLTRIGQYGAKYQELIAGHKTFSISPDERRLNQNLVARKEYDFFTNGTFQAVKLYDDEPDTESLRQNPNVLDDVVGAKVFKLKGEKFRDRIDAISSATAVERLKDMARDPKNECTLQQFEILNMRLRELQADVTEVSTGAGTMSGSRPVAL